MRGGEKVRVRVGDAETKFSAITLTNELGMMGLLVAALRAHNLLAILAR